MQVTPVGSVPAWNASHETICLAPVAADVCNGGVVDAVRAEPGEGVDDVLGGVGADAEDRAVYCLGSALTGELPAKPMAASEPMAAVAAATFTSRSCEWT